MKRITHKHLDEMIRIINRRTKNAEKPYTNDENGIAQPNPGCFYLDEAYGGCKLVQMNPNGGTGEIDVLESGYVSKRELFNLMRAFDAGLQYEYRRQMREKKNET